MSHPPVILDAAMRKVVRAAIEDDCRHRNRHILALNVRTNHVHLVVRTTDEIARVLHDVKAWATRRLREVELIPKDQPVWGVGGDQRVLDTPESIQAAIEYVTDGQGPELPEA